MLSPTKIVANLTVIAILVHGVTSSGRSVLCVESNGDATVEHFGCACGSDGDRHSPTKSPASEHADADHSDACTPCVDIPLGVEDGKLQSRTAFANKSDSAPSYRLPLKIDIELHDLRVAALLPGISERMPHLAECANIPLRI